MTTNSLRLSMVAGDTDKASTGGMAAARAAAERIERCLARLWQRPASRADVLELRKLGEQLVARMIPQPAVTRLAAEQGIAVSLADPDGLLPLELGFVGNQFLGLRHAIGRELSTHPPAVDCPTGQVRPLQGGIIADSQFNLLYAQYEAQDVCRLWRESGVFHEIEVLGSHVKLDEALDLIGRCDWLHVCGHAVPENDQRGWSFRDGRLLPEMLVSAGLKRVPKFVFAHACQSAPRCADGAGRWTDLFAELGTTHFLGTSVPIPDCGTFPFVETVYRRLLKGEPIGSAVLAGRQALAASQEPNGLLWACYLLFGDPGTRLWQPRVSAASEGARSIDRGAGWSPLPTPVVETPVAHCDICGQAIFTRHGIAETEPVSDSTPRTICRACARRSTPDVAHDERPAAVTERPPLSREITASPATCGHDRGPESLPSGWRDFAMRWTHTVNRFRTYRDPETGRDHAVRLVSVSELVTTGKTTGYRLELEDGTRPENWPRLLLDLRDEYAPSAPRPCSMGDLRGWLKVLPTGTDGANWVIALGAADGWEAEVLESVRSESWRLTETDSNWAVVLFDRTSKRFCLSDGDARVLAFRDLFDLETDGEKIRRAVDAIGRLRPLEVSLSVETLVRQFGLPESILVPAMRQAAEEFGLHLDDVPGYGWVISS